MRKVSFVSLHTLPDAVTLNLQTRKVPLSNLTHFVDLFVGRQRNKLLIQMAKVRCHSRAGCYYLIVLIKPHLQLWMQNRVHMTPDRFEV